MNPEAALWDKLRKIEALFAGAGTPGEKVAAGAAALRTRATPRMSRSRRGSEDSQVLTRSSRFKGAPAERHGAGAGDGPPPNRPSYPLPFPSTRRRELIKCMKPS